MTKNSRLRAVLVTGGCGFLGTNLVRYLSRKGYTVRILDNLSTPSSTWTPDPHSVLRSLPAQPTALLVGDIRNREIVHGAVEGIDAVVHLAARASVVESLKSLEES